MQISFYDVFISVVALVIMMIPGYLLTKLKAFRTESAQAFSTLVMYGCQTLMVFMCFQSYSFSSTVAVNMLIVGGLTTLCHLIMYLIMSLCIRGKDDKAKCIRYAGVFGNCGFMGIPFLQMLFSGSEALGEIMIYTAVVISVFNILNWTLGVFIITGDAKQISVKKIVFNPVIIAVILGFLAFFIIKKPISDIAEQGSALDKFLEKVMKSFQSVADAVTPLSMTVIGMKLADGKLKDLFTEKKAYISSAFKLIVSAVVVTLVVVFLPIAEEVKYTVFLLMIMPTATSTTLFAEIFGGNGRFGSKCVLLSSILSIATISLTFLGFNFLMGII